MSSKDKNICLYYRFERGLCENTRENLGQTNNTSCSTRHYSYLRLTLSVMNAPINLSSKGDPTVHDWCICLY